MSKVAYDLFIDVLTKHGAKQDGRNWTCPVHEDDASDPSMTVDDADNRVLVNCKAGCDTRESVAALGLSMGDLFDETGCTLDLYSLGKQLPVEFLEKQGLKEQRYHGAPAVRMPYLDLTGKEVAVRYRVLLEGDGKFRFKTGSHPCLYGIWHLPKIKKAGWVVLVEGESCAHTLWYAGIPALALPGAGMWSEERDAAVLDGIERIFVVVEPDQGGDTVLRWVGNSRIKERVRLVSFAEHKDASDAYLADPATFAERLDTALEAATPWDEFTDSRNREVEREAWETCAPLATAENILDLFVADLRRYGVVGEERAACLVYLALTSRQLDRPVSVAVKGPSSGGKSFTVEVTLDFFPPEAYYALSAMSERALAYSEEPLSHRHLVLFEAAALQGEFASYLIRSLLSEGCVRYETVEKTEEGLRPRLIERAGPTGLIVTTTSVQLHPENETRMLSVQITDTKEQTRAIFRAIADERDRDINLAAWHALQTWISVRDAQVAIPYAVALAETIPPLAVRLRRDFKTILNLIAAHALLHQASRERDGDDRIVATLDDYEVVRSLIVDLISQSVAATVSPETRQTVEVVADLIDANGCANDDEDEDANADASGRANRTFRIAFHEGGISISEIAKALDLDVSAAHRRVSVAIKGGFLKNLETRRYQKARVVVGDPLPEERGILPTRDEVVCAFAQFSRGVDSNHISAASGGRKTHARKSPPRNRANVQTPKEET